jgi:hypothetical protein
LLIDSRADRPPLYGDDFWDWGMILECFLEVSQRLGSCLTHDFVKQEMGAFCDHVVERLAGGLTTGSGVEWFGPATAAAAHHVLARCRSPRCFVNQSVVGSSPARGAKKSATKLSSRPVNGEPREKMLAGFLRFRVLW